MATKRLDSTAARCSGCDKTHQFRLISDDQRGEVAVVSGKELRFPGKPVAPGRESYDLGVSLVETFTERGAARCPLKGM